MAENRWQRIKQWFVARDPDEVAREAYLLASEHHEIDGGGRLDDHHPQHA